MLSSDESSQVRPIGLAAVLAFSVVAVRWIIDRANESGPPLAAVWSEAAILVSVLGLGSWLAFQVSVRTRPRLRDRLQARRRRRSAHLCVLLAPSGSILIAGVAELLGREPGLEIYKLPTTDESSLAPQIERCRPDVVILDIGPAPADPPNPTDLLARHPRLRVVVVGSDSDVMEVYDRAQVILRAVPDLIAVLRGAGSAPRRTCAVTPSVR